jgi:hypothetical protein
MDMDGWLTVDQPERNLRHTGNIILHLLSRWEDRTLTYQFELAQVGNAVSPEVVIRESTFHYAS